MIGEPEAEARQPLLMLNGYAATGADWDPTFLELLGGFARPLTAPTIAASGRRRSTPNPAS